MHVNEYFVFLYCVLFVQRIQVIQKLEDPPRPPSKQKKTNKKLIICQTIKSGKFVKPQKKLSNLQTQKKDLAKFQNQKNIGRASLSNFERWPLGQITCSPLMQLAKRFLASWIFLHDSAQTPLIYNKEL